MEVVILACWNIRGMVSFFMFERPTFFSWKRSFVHDISMLGHRIKQKHHSSLMAWIGSLQ
jgi:hypothetical protein